MLLFVLPSAPSWSSLSDPDYHVPFDESAFPTRDSRMAAGESYVAGYYKDGFYVNSSVMVVLPSGEEWNPRYDADGAEYRCANLQTLTKASARYLGPIGRKGASTALSSAQAEHGDDEHLKVVKSDGDGESPDYSGIVWESDGGGHGTVWLERDGHVLEIEAEAPGVGQVERFFRALSGSEDSARGNYAEYAFAAPELRGRRCSVPSVGLEFPVEGDFELACWLPDSGIAPVARVAKPDSSIDDMKIDIELVGVYDDEGQAGVRAEADAGAGREGGGEEIDVSVEGAATWCYRQSNEVSGHEEVHLYLYDGGYLVKLSFRGMEDPSEAERIIGAASHAAPE